MDSFATLDFETGKTTVFVPKMDNFYKIWMTTLNLEEYAKKYPLIDEFRYTDEIEDYFKALQPAQVYLNVGVNSCSKLTSMSPNTQVIEKASPNTKIDKDTMHDILVESRVFKNDEEL
jgi:Xaa-Pro dipeptidase